MASRYIEMRERVIIEVGSPGEGRDEMSGGVLSRLSTSITEIEEVIDKVVRPIGRAFADLHKTLDVPIEVEKAEVKLGLSFSGEGNIFVTKVSAEGTLEINVTFAVVKSSKPRSRP